MSDTAATEFGFVQAFPKRTKSKLEKLTEHIAEVRRLNEQHGVLIPATYAATLLGVSRQRVDELMSDGRLVRLRAFDHVYVTEESMKDYARTERKAGRPPKVPSMRETFSGAMHAVREVVGK